MARQSVYPAASFDFLESLDACVTYTEESAISLQSSITNFEPGVRDLQRLSKILVNKHHFLVLPTPQIQAHQSTLSQSLAPQIESLIAKAETVVTSQSKRVANLEERLSIIQSARLPRTGTQPAKQASIRSEGGLVDGENEDAVKTGSALEGLKLADLSAAQRRKVVMLRGKRAKLEKELLELDGAS